MRFEPKKTDYELSPYTGLTREDWIDACKYLLGGIFKNVDKIEMPLTFQRLETDITYPHKNLSEKAHEGQLMAERFEGLARSLFIAAPLIAEDPEILINGISLRNYYKFHILKACESSGGLTVGRYCELAKNSENFCFQQTVEIGALVIGLFVTKNQIWDSYTAAERDLIAEFISEYAHGNTINQNWRFFNMLSLAFLHMNGYPIDKDIMLDHAQSILSYYAGGGWYRDGQNFDYYSCWGFQFYAPIWNKWYGFDNLPQIAEQFRAYSDELMLTFPDLFDKNGSMLMWGRSCIYRFGVLSAFYGNILSSSDLNNVGLFRRIASGCLMQFLGRDDFLGDNNIPTLGFYGQFPPMVQSYSCTESVFWLGKAFMLLTLDKNHAFWTEKEAKGTFERLKEKQIKTTVINGAGLAYTNHQANGATVLRTGKVLKSAEDLAGIRQYAKLDFHSRYTWCAAPNENSECGQYVLKNDGGVYLRANAVLWHGEREGVLYRKAMFGYKMSTAFHWTQSMYLADFAVPYGIFRADKIKFYTRPVCITLGSYGFPDNGTEIIKRTKADAQAVILKGYDSQGNKKQLAMTVFGDWDVPEIIKSEDINPDSKNSLVICARTRRVKQYGYENYLLLSQVITRENHDDFTDDEIFPLAEIAAMDDKNFSAYGRTLLKLKDGNEKAIDFSGIEGDLQL